MPTDDIALLQELLSAYGPGGEEREVREICRRELEPLVDELSVERRAISSASCGGRTTRPR